MKRAACMLLLLLLVAVASAALADGSFKLDRDNNKLFEGQVLELTLNVSGDPAGAEITWKSSNGKVAQVDEAGRVTGLNKGTTTITASCKAGGRTWKSSLEVTVQRPVSSIEVNEKNLKVYDPSDAFLEGLISGDGSHRVIVLAKGGTANISATLEPRDASSRRFALESSNPEIASVGESSIRGREKGQCEVKVYSKLNPEVSVTYTVLVVQRVKNVKVTLDSREIGVGDQTQAYAVLTPDEASIQKVTWTSTDERVATVDDQGVVTALARGQTTIRATAADGSNVRGGTALTVAQMAEAISVDQEAVTIATGRYITVRATVLPQNTNNKKVMWTSTDESIAKVNGNGRITGVKAGTCQVVAACATDAELEAVVNVTVIQPVTRISFTTRTETVNVGESVQLFWQVDPVDVTDGRVTFASSNPNVATVDENGLVQGLRRGTANITATAVDGSRRSARVQVQVLQPVWGVHMAEAIYGVGVDEVIQIQAVLEPADASNRHMTWTSDNEYYAIVRGKSIQPDVVGKHWGSTIIRGVTEDGGYETQCTVNVGNYNKALKITDLYVMDNRIRMVVLNESNLQIDRFFFTVNCYDINGAPLMVNQNGTNTFSGSYEFPLAEGQSTSHNMFTFDQYWQPDAEIARVDMVVSGFITNTGVSWTIYEPYQSPVEYKSASYVGPVVETTQSSETVSDLVPETGN